MTTSDTRSRCREREEPDVDQEEFPVHGVRGRDVVCAASAQAQDASTTAPAALAAPAATEAGQAPTNETGTTAQEIVVSGIRGSLDAAKSIKRNSDQIVDAIVAQDIGKFPDPTVALRCSACRACRFRWVTTTRS